MSNKEDRAHQRSLDKIASSLGETFDAVFITVSYRDDQGKGWTQVASGAGNWFARRGMVEEWLEKSAQQDLAQAIGNEICRESDDE